MAIAGTISGDLQVLGALTVTGSLPSYARTYLVQENEAEHNIDFVLWRKWDDFAALLPAASSSDDLGLYTGTWGTDVPYIATDDLKNAGATNKRAGFKVQLPPWYVAGETVKLRFMAGMKTTVASSSATIDAEAYLTDEFGLVSGSDLVTTAATTINSTTQANKEFLLTSTSLTPGDEIYVRVTVAVNDSGTGTAVIGKIGKASLLLDIKG